MVYTCKYSEQDCIDALHEASEQLGGWYTRPEYTELGLKPSKNAIARILGDGSWSQAKRRAGLETKEFSSEECIEALHEAHDRLGRSAKLAEYREMDISPCAMTIARRAGDGSWRKVHDEADLPRPAFTQGQCLEAMSDASEFFDGNYTKRDYREAGFKPTYDTICRVVEGGWTAGKKAIGLEPWIKRPRTCSVNDNYFSDLDTDEKAYWLGFLYADGFINPERNKIQLAIQAPDEPHLDAFKSAIDSTYATTYYENDHKDMVSTMATSPIIVYDLMSLGCGPDKTKSPSLPQLRYELFAHFIRGYSDGDGSVTENQWSLRSSSKKRLQKIRKWFHSQGLSSVGLYGEYEYGVGTPRLSVANIPDRKLLRSIMYPQGENTTPSLDRKMEIAFDWDL